MTADYSPAALAAAAGVDPWALARTVTDGRPDEVRRVGQAFQRARTQAVGAARLAAVADRTTAAAYVNDGTQVWDADAAGRRTRGLLSENGDDMEDVGRTVTLVADELASTSSAVEKELATLTDRVDGVIARRNAFFAAVGPLASEDRTVAEQGFLGEAVGLVRGCAGRIQGDLDAYGRVLTSRTGFLADLGYEVPAEDGPDVLGPRIIGPETRGPEILGTPPGTRYEGGLEPGVVYGFPGPDGGVVVGTPPAPDLGTGRTGGGALPFPVPDGGRVFTSGGTGDAGGTDQEGGTETPDEPPAIEEGKQGRHQPDDPNFQPGRSILTADPHELIKQAGSGEQVGAIPVGEPGSKERIDFGHEIGINVDRDGNQRPTTVGIVHYSKNGAHIVPGRPT